MSFNSAFPVALFVTVMSVTVLGLVAADFDARVSQLEELENRTDLAAFCHRCALIWEAVLFL